MDRQLRNTIERLLDRHRVMTIATNRPDGWPQATTVGYAHDGLTIYFLCGRDSQKAANIARDNRVSITIDRDVPHVLDIKGLSLAGHARPVTDRNEAIRVLELLLAQYPEDVKLLPAKPSIDDVLICAIEPVVISVLDYSQGFGHTDLVEVDGESTKTGWKRMAEIISARG
jgi:nitroimidazol reductase NimA-like FMN-containing flavoprotein (pyridoxamine 5'-phosphate oxidase superfamily)